MGLWIILGVIGAGLILLIVSHDAGSVMGIANDSFAGVLYLGIWATVIGAAALPRAGQWREAARNAAIWISVILVLMAGYVYRYELQDVASRMSAGIIPGSPVSGQSADGRGQVTVIRGSDGHFRIDASVIGTKVAFLVDTGASSVVLSHADAVAAHFETP